MTISDMIAKLRDQGVRLTADGENLRWSAPDAWPTRERLEFLRAHKAEILAYLNNIQSRDNCEPKPTGSKLGGFNRLELAMDILARLIPDERSRQRIKTLAEADARNWRHLGADGYRHVLANDIIDATEKASGEFVCFVGPDEDGLFTDWFLAEKKHRCGNVGLYGLITAQDNASVGLHQSTDNNSNKLPVRQRVLFKEQP